MFMEDSSRSPLPPSSSPLSIPKRHRSASNMPPSSLSDAGSPSFGSVPFKPSLLSTSSPGAAFHHHGHHAASARMLSSSVPVGHGAHAGGSPAQESAGTGPFHSGGVMMSPSGGSAESYGTDLFCPQCGKSYRYTRQLEKHMWEHSPAWAIVSQFNYSKNEHCKILDAAEILCSFRQEPM